MSDYIRNIKKLELTTRRKVFSIFVGNYISMFKGQGIEFQDLREYVPGDNIKDIDWNTTAKTGALYVRKYIETRELTILFGIDVSSSMNWGTIEDYPKKDIIMNLIILLSLAAEKNNDRVGAIFFNDKIEGTLPFRKGKAHMLRILKESEKFYKDNYFKTTDIKSFLRYLLDGLSKKTICFIFTDEYDYQDSELRKLLKAVNKRHEVIFVHIQDVMDIFRDLTGTIEFQDIETGKNIELDMSQESVKNTLFEKIEDENFNLRRFFQGSRMGYIPVNQRSDLLLTLISFFKKRKLEKYY